MQLISYVSDSIISSDHQNAEVIQLVTDAQKRNASLGVTGVLFLENGHFFQTIEGPRKTLQQLFAQIENDSRHTNLIKLADEPVSARAFDGWDLDCFKMDNPDLINPKVLTRLRSLYFDSFGSNVAGLIDFVKHMVEELDMYKINSDLQQGKNLDY